jgi:hypothetical protein
MRPGRTCGSKWGCYYFLFGKKILKLLVHCHVFVHSPSGRRPLINIQSTLRTASALCTNVALAVLLDNSGNLYTISTRQMCIHTHVLRNTEKLIGQKLKRMGQQ